MKPIAFNATVIKKARPAPVQAPAKRVLPSRREMPLPAEKTSPSPSVPAAAQSTQHPINPMAFYRFQPMENIVMESPQKSAPVAPSMPVPPLHTYAALKTARLQHEQILARIKK